MNGAENMRLNYKVKQQMVNAIDSFSNIEGVRTYCKSDLDGVFTVVGHPPLSTVKYRYICENHLLTKNFSLKLMCQIETRLPDCKIRCIYKKKRIQFECDNAILDISVFLSSLQNNIYLSKLINTVDFSRLEIIISRNISCIELEPLINSVIQFFLPPAVYLLRSSKEECIDILQIMQLILCCLKQFEL